MKRNVFCKSLFCVVLAVLILLGIPGCANEHAAHNDQYVGKQFDFDAASDPFAASQMAFSLELFQRAVAASGEGENTLISPLSVCMALSMTACGASGETRAQMEAMLARGITFDELLEGLGAIRQGTYEEQKAKVRVANSLWARKDAIQLEQAFLAQNEEYFGSVVYERAFNGRTLNEINDWVSDSTDGMIPTVLDDIDQQTVMYLINTLYFEAKWSEPYDSVRQGTFTTTDGTLRYVETLSSSETYYDDGLAKGFSKYYEGYKYEFVAMLPNEGVSIEDYVASLTSENLLGMLRSGGVSGYVAWATLPKFELQYDDAGRMEQILKDMGMTDAWNATQADFSAMGRATDGPLYVGSVVHKTAMNVDENGTRAAAATAVGMGAGGMPEIVDVTFDRPFICMIVDRETKIPLFMAVVMDVK